MLHLSEEWPQCQKTSWGEKQRRLCMEMVFFFTKCDKSPERLRWTQVAAIRWIEQAAKWQDTCLKSWQEPQISPFWVFLLCHHVSTRAKRKQTLDQHSSGRQQQSQINENKNQECMSKTTPTGFHRTACHAQASDGWVLQKRPQALSQSVHLDAFHPSEQGRNITGHSS